MRKLFKPLTFGPGIFAIGYTIGTGSVTSMIVAGSTFGMQLLWVLLLSCIFSGVLIYVYGQYTLVTKETALYAFKKHLPFGKIIALLILVGISFGQWNSLIGILGITSNVVFEVLLLYRPELIDHKYGIVLFLAVLIIGTMYIILIKGDYSVFEKVLALLVTFMGLSFFFTLFFVVPLPKEVIQGLIPRIPRVEGGSMLTAAFVGTTMASATFISRSLFVTGKGWGLEQMKLQKKDAIIAATLVFIISGSIMTVANGSLHKEGILVEKVVDMSQALTPLAGKFAVSIFFFGTLSAGLSSIFPCLLIVPIMISDYKSGVLDTKSTQFKWITGIASLLALTIPVFGFNPIKGQLLTQVFNVFVLPLVIISIIILINSNRLGEYKINGVIKGILFVALLFSIVISVNGASAVAGALFD